MAVEKSSWNQKLKKKILLSDDSPMNYLDEDKKWEKVSSFESDKSKVNVQAKKTWRPETKSY